jgi:hypothetical protein
MNYIIDAKNHVKTALFGRVEVIGCMVDTKERVDKL